MPVSSTQDKWLNFLQVVHCGMLAPFFIMPEHVSHLVFLGAGAQLLVSLLKKSKISLSPRDARGKAEWWHWSQIQSTLRFFRSRYWRVLILAHFTWKHFLQWLQEIWVRLVETGLGQSPQRLSGIEEIIQREGIECAKN